MRRGAEGKPLCKADASDEDSMDCLEAQQVVAPIGTWSSDLCACCADCAVCWSTWCCPWVVIAQLAQRHSQLKPNGAKVYRCRSIALVLSVLLGLSYLCKSIYKQALYNQMNRASEQCYRIDERSGRKYWLANCVPTPPGEIGLELWLTASTRCSNSEQSSCAPAVRRALLLIPAPTCAPRAGLGSVLGMVASIAMICIVLSVRTRVRRQERIPTSCCDEGCDDCCCACCCLPCTTCQLMRHTLARAPVSSDMHGHPTAPPAVYELCSEEGCHTVAPVVAVHAVHVAVPVAAHPLYGTSASGSAA